MPNGAKLFNIGHIKWSLWTIDPEVNCNSAHHYWWTLFDSYGKGTSFTLQDRLI